MTSAADVLTNLCTSIYSKFADKTTALEAFHNDFYTSVNGQLFEDDAPLFAQYPYAVYSLPSVRKRYTFSEEETNTYLQLFLYSDNMDTSEIKLIYRYAMDLFDECSLSITGSSLVWMKEDNVMFGIDHQITQEGTKRVLTYTVNIEVLTSLN